MSKINISLFLLFQASLFFCSNGSIIILYGTSSAGKTSISAKLGQLLGEKWKVVGIDMFPKKYRIGTANEAMWAQANLYISKGFNVVVDTVISEFLISNKKSNKFVVLTYCAPNILAQHVSKRNEGDKDHDHRDLRKVLSQYYGKYRPTEDSKESIDTLYKTNLENASECPKALKNFIKDFFRKDSQIVYVASLLYQYDFFINSGKNSIELCAKKIKDAFESWQEKITNNK